jgi:hypothetical protein
MGPIPLLIALGMFVNGAELVDFLIEYTAEVVFCGNHARDLQQMALSVYNTSGSTALVAYKYGQTVDLLQTLRVVYQYVQTVDSQQTLRAVGSAALVVYQHGSSRLHMSEARGYVVYQQAYARGYVVCQHAYEYVFAQPVCPVPTEQGCPAPPESPGSGEQMPLNEPVKETTQSWNLPVMVVQVLVMLLLGFWVIVVFYRKKKLVAKPTVPTEHVIAEQVPTEPEIAAPVIAEPVPEEPVIEEPLPVKPDSDTPARVGLSTTASADHRLEMFQFKMRLAKA